MAERVRIVHPDGRSYKVYEKDYERLYREQGFEIAGGFQVKTGSDALEDLPYSELRERAKAAGISGNSRMNRETLIEKLSEKPEVTADSAES